MQEINVLDITDLSWLDLLTNESVITWKREEA